MRIVIEILDIVATGYYDDYGSEKVVDGYCFSNRLAAARAGSR